MFPDDILQIIFEYDMDNYRYWEEKDKKYPFYFDNKQDGWKLLYKISEGIYPKNTYINDIYIIMDYDNEHLINTLIEKLYQFNIKSIDLEYCNISPSTKFPNTLDNLNLYNVNCNDPDKGYDEYRGDVINLPSGLIYLDISESNIKLPYELPHCLERLSITKMVISQESPPNSYFNFNPVLDLSNLKNLEYLWFGKRTNVYNLKLPSKFGKIDVGSCNIHKILIPEESSELIKNIEYSEYIEYSDDVCEINFY